MTKTLYRHHGLPLLLLAFVLCSALNLRAMAEVITVPLHQVYQVNPLVLPTTNSQQVIPLEIPNHWQVNGSSYLNLHFQHSKALIPSRSYLDVIFNEQRVKRIPLTQANANASSVKIPLNKKWLDYNKLKLSVEQHYIDDCEDPLHSSLWTEVLKDSTLSINYQKQAPVINLGVYPKPLVFDNKLEAPTLNWILPVQPSLLTNRAMVETALHLTASVPEQTVSSQVALVKAGELASVLAGVKGHAILIATPGDLPDLLNMSVFKGFRLVNGQWTRTKNNQALADDEAMIRFVPRGNDPKQALLVVTGNTEKALVNGAKFLSYLAANPQQKLNSRAMTVTGDWQRDFTQSTKSVARYLFDGHKTLEDLGYETQQVYHINAPPITYQLPLAQLVNSQDDLQLDLIYSYSYALNPKFSSLELRLNDRPLKSYPLTNPAGQEQVRASVVLPKHLLKPNSQLVAQFHLYKDKEGRCVDTVDDNTWGIIHGESALKVASRRQAEPPLAHPTGFPFLRNPDLADLHVIIPPQLSAQKLNMLLAFVARLGQLTGFYAGQADMFNVTLSDNKGNLPSDRQVIAFDLDSKAYELENQSTAFLKLASPTKNQLSLRHDANAHWQNSASYPTIEQQPLGGDHYRWLISAKTANAVSLLTKTLKTDEDFEALKENTFHHTSNIVQLAPSADLKGVTVNRLQLKSPQVQYQAKENFDIWRWMTRHPFWTALIVLAGIILVLIVLALLSAIFRKPSSRQ